MAAIGDGVRLCCRPSLTLLGVGMAQKGDILTNMKRVNDGWYFGKLEKTGASGLVPQNYVQPEAGSDEADA